MAAYLEKEVRMNKKLFSILIILISFLLLICINNEIYAVTCPHCSWSTARVVSSTSPTCSSAGSITYECPASSGCGSQWTVTNGAATGKHSGGSATCVKLAVCSTCGSSYGNYGSHSYNSYYTVDSSATCESSG